MAASASESASGKPPTCARSQAGNPRLLACCTSLSLGSTMRARRSGTLARINSKAATIRSEEHTSELQSLRHLVFLLSFPTRRSPDLPASWPAAPASRWAAPCARADRAPWPGSIPRPPPSDRKSTRLNSSHLGISYFYSLSLHAALPISQPPGLLHQPLVGQHHARAQIGHLGPDQFQGRHHHWQMTREFAGAAAWQEQ